MRRLAPELPRATRVLIFTGPLFAPAALAAPFAIAYQDALGLSAAQIGLLSGLVAALSFVFLLLGAPAAERWGRLRAITVFDVAGFVLPGLAFALARTSAEVAGAALLGALAQGAQAGFQGLLMAELRPDLRPRVLALEHLLVALPSAAMPLLAGLLVATWGLVPAVRVLYIVSAASIAAMVLLRWHLLRGAPRPPPDRAPAPRVVETLRALRGAGLSPVLAGSALLAFGGGLGVLLPLRALHVLLLPDWWLGPLAFAGTAADFLASAVAAQRLRSARGLASVGAVLAALGAIFVVFARGPVLLVASAAAMGLAGAWSGLGAGAMLHDRVPEAMRDRAVVAQLALRALATLAGTTLAGALYDVDTGLPWVFAAIAFAAAVPFLGFAKDANSGHRSEEPH